MNINCWSFISSLRRVCWILTNHDRNYGWCSHEVWSVCLKNCNKVISEKETVCLILNQQQQKQAWYYTLTKCPYTFTEQKNQKYWDALDTPLNDHYPEGNRDRTISHTISTAWYNIASCILARSCNMFIIQVIYSPSSVLIKCTRVSLADNNLHSGAFAGGDIQIYKLRFVSLVQAIALAKLSSDHQQS